MSSGRWIAVGSAILGAGVLLAVSWFVYVRQAHEGFWSWPGMLGVIITGVGFAMLLVGFVMPKEDSEAPIRQVQQGGNHSTNLQAGRDIRFGPDRSGE
jgi:hypothetical protein